MAYLKHLSLFVPLVALCIWAMLAQESCSNGRAESQLRAANSANARTNETEEPPRYRR